MIEAFNNPFAEDLKRRTGRDVAVVDDAERPVPLTFSWSLEAPNWRRSVDRA